MVRRTTHLALVVLAVLVATGPSALVVADAAAVEPLDATDDLSDDEMTDGSLTDENTTDDANGDLTDATDENVTEDETVENETVNGETTDATAEDVADSGTIPEPRDPASDATNEAENATSITDGTDIVGTNVDETDLAGVVGTVDDAANGVTDADTGDVSLDATASSSRADADDVGDTLEDRDADAESNDDEPVSGSQDGSDSAAERDARTENEGRTENGTTAAGTGDAKSPANGADSDGSPDRDSSGAPPSGTETVAGVGALAAVALFPHFADGLSLAGDAGKLSASSSTAASSRSLVLLQGEFDKVWRTATAFRYSRYDDSDPLAHETRATLHETVERSPGAYLSQVCERADVAVSTARHHLDVLEDEGLVTTEKVRGKRRYFPGHSDDVELAAALEDEEAAAVLRALARLGDSHGGRLADELDRDPSTVSHHLSRLEDAGLVEREREGRAVVNRLAPGVERVLGGEEIEGDGEADAEAPAVAD